MLLKVASDDACLDGGGDLRRRFILYTANHGKQDGIEDYLTMFNRMLAAAGLTVEASTTLCEDAINIVIDEFTNAIQNRRIAEFCQNNPNSRCVYVLTEFVQRKYGIESFNHFGGVFDAASIALFNVYLRWRRADFPALRLRDLALALFYSPVLLVYFCGSYANYVARRLMGKPTANPVSFFVNKNHRLIYFHMRYLGLMAHMRYAHAAISSHEAIAMDSTEEPGILRNRLKSLGVVYPEFDEKEVLSSLMKNREPFVEITGSVTPYRQLWIRRVNSFVRVSGIGNAFGLTQALPFAALASQEPPERGAYSLHPPQTRKWPYCSPTRIYRALQIDHNLPVLTKHFRQSPIEDVCFIVKDLASFIQMVEMYFDRKALFDFIAPRIQKYNQIAKQRNNQIVQSLIEMAEIQHVPPAAGSGRT